MSRTSAKFGVLAFLRWRPESYGYWIYNKFENAFPGWEVTPQGIYAALDKMHEDGWIEPLEKVEVGAGCNRTPYRLTPTGEQHFDHFLRCLDLLAVPREYFSLGVRIAAWEGLDAVLTLLDDLEERVGAQLDGIRSVPAPTELTELGDWLFVKDKQHALYGRLGWIQDAREAALAVAGGEGHR